ncbi:hypothetical protein PCH70_34370 [Pseudomonas cichorii JBC1]|nr:hypothetical protein PCH70_34370 [Pseudomonas cichorii JBC1]
MYQHLFTVCVDPVLALLQTYRRFPATALLTAIFPRILDV